MEDTPYLKLEVQALDYVSEFIVSNDKLIAFLEKVIKSKKMEENEDTNFVTS